MHVSPKITRMNSLSFIFLIWSIGLIWDISAFSDQSGRFLHPKQMRKLNKESKSIRTKSVEPKNVEKEAKPKKLEENYSSLSDQERIQKVIARAGLASRREAEHMITNGRVSVNGKMIKELGFKINAKKDSLYVDGKLVVLPSQTSFTWIVLNKPRDCLSTLQDDKSRDTILKYLPKANDLRLVPVGRMDRDTSGLLLLTNDVGWIHPLTHPSYHSMQRYEITIRGDLDVSAVDAAREGKLQRPGGKEFLPAVAIYVAQINARDKTWLIDFIVEDLPASILFEIIEAWGCEYLSSRRTEYGPIHLGNLQKGDWKELSSSDILSLKTFSKKLPSSSRPRFPKIFHKKIESSRKLGEMQKGKRRSTPFQSKNHYPLSPKI